MLSIEDDILLVTSALERNKNVEKTVRLPPVRKSTITRSIKKNHIYYRNCDGTVSRMTPKDTTWYKLYLQSEPSNGRLAAIFRNRIRIPYASFMSLAQELKQSPLFKRYNSEDCVGSPSVDLRILLLGTLSYMERSFTFDDLEEATVISRESHRIFSKHL